MGMLKDVIGSSISSKPKEMEEAKSKLGNEDYASSDQEELMRLMNTPGVVYEKDIAGKFTPSYNLPTIQSAMSLFNKDVFYKPNTKRVTDAGDYYASGSRLSDEEGKAIFKNGLLGGGAEGVRSEGMKIVNAINKMYPGLDEEEKWNKAWVVFRDSQLPEADKESVNTTNQDKTSGGGGFGYDSDNWNVQKTIDRDGNEWVNINKKTGGNITIKATKLFGVDGKFYEMTVGNIISYRHDNKNRVIAKVGGVGFDENGNKITISEREMFLDESQWGLITNTIGSDIGLLNLKRSLKAVNVAVPRKKQSGETSYDWSNEKPE
jgi:hypothetical protein